MSVFKESIKSEHKDKFNWVFIEEVILLANNLNANKYKNLTNTIFTWLVKKEIS